MKTTRTPLPLRPAPAVPTASSGVQFLQWVAENLRLITHREAGNEDTLHLYAHGDYWHAFERSAYQLVRRHPEAQLSQLSFTTYPFPLIIATLSDATVRRHLAAHSHTATHLVLPAPRLTPEAYYTWLTHHPELP